MSSLYRSLAELPYEALVERAKGCLLGGALGDALGAPVEFMSLAEIRQKYGHDGIQQFHSAYGVKGAITDDTQMTLFSAEGLIRAKVRFANKGICASEQVVAYAYQRWLSTQGETCDPFATGESVKGWLMSVSELHARRAPGLTCLSALRVWKREPAINDSKGCGTVMRSAPFGFVEDGGDMAAKCAAITHGHVEAQVSAAIFAIAIQNLVLGASLEDALDSALEGFESSNSGLLVRRAVALSQSDINCDEAIRELCQGWTADEALAIGVYAALAAKGDFVSGVRIAVNHDGDSDSTGSICGNLLGAFLGLGGLPADWLNQLELRAVIEQVAEDLVAPSSVVIQDEFWDRYPGC